jgi:hypothetical protein
VDIPTILDAIAQSPGGFIFTLNTGDLLVGIVPIETSPSDGLSIQVTGGQANIAGTGSGALCTNGALIPVNPATPTDAKAVTSQSYRLVSILLRARFDPRGLVAYAHVSYVDAQSHADAPYVSSLCTGGVDSPHAADLISGCPDITTPCAQPLEAAVPAVTGYDAAMLGAQSSKDWSAVYKQSAETITGQYSSADLSDALNAQVAKVGKITAISPVTAAPDIQTGTVGQPFFSVSQQVTIDSGGQTSTRQVTSYFLLEQGAWRFWFSA